MSWEEGLEDRRARLAALRKNRFNKTSSEASPSTHSDPTPPQSATPSSVPTEAIETPEQDGEIKEPPALQLDHGETVEVLSNNIQQQILRSARERANDISFVSETAPRKVSYTKDLEDSIQDLDTKAHNRTERAVYNIIKAKYEAYGRV
ncbi:uncharacterized protein CANTADRAFT_49540 [Suhomyces tanzawaensis NRRL Y-17324]|uniref:Uncharacterized protein n=1 Tax=Suhomyces tanzawaensis NRRL Y-17324 TaxID=984487 RepID=A0A1E4SK08_9ASCO|nr:uncharacterized protein CANTADRAFT_49540 [Suhomyces tanzawaensis NRRL Y-17324]ODV79839.1 hypothetical protein CANTADRAFT_49540 [Suhomyces tanzawaensis NRRL Y-17324]